MSQIKVMVVDDHIVVRTGLQALLNKQADIEVVADAENGSEALDKAQKKKPDVVIMDITMPVMDGIEATKKLKKALPECYILALTIHEDKHYLLKMLEAGANGYISKQAGSKTLVTAILIRLIIGNSFYAIDCSFILVNVFSSLVLLFFC